MGNRQLTTTSYAILGFLAIRPWTTYELAQQMERTLSRTWPRARSKLYEEPKKLVAHGLATATSESTGRRRRTVYTITTDGRQALAEWLAIPGAGPTLEFEGLIKLFFADQGPATMRWPPSRRSTPGRVNSSMRSPLQLTNTSKAAARFPIGWRSTRSAAG